jgi:hypothetical protein
VAQQLHISHDPLHTGCIPLPVCEPVVEIGMLDCPKLSCEVETTSYGYTLTGVGHYVTLSHISGPILQMMDGNTTIGNILNEFGPISLELIGGLIQKQLVKL